MDPPPPPPPPGATPPTLFPEQQTMLNDYTAILRVARNCVLDPEIPPSTIFTLFETFCARHPYFLRSGDTYCTQLLNHFMANTQSATSFLHTNDSMAVAYSHVGGPPPPPTRLLIPLPLDIKPGPIPSSRLSTLTLRPLRRHTKPQSSFRPTKLPYQATDLMYCLL
jgi:hypothetical protein